MWTVEPLVLVITKSAKLTSFLKPIMKENDDEHIIMYLPPPHHQLTTVSYLLLANMKDFHIPT